MDPRIAARFHDGILEVVLSRYGLERDAICRLGSYSNLIYAFERPAGAYILRLGHSLERNVDLIRGEVDWINYLAAGGVGVARAIPSLAGNLVEPVDDGQGGHFLATAFCRAPGGPFQGDLLDERFCRTYGRLLGRMHALATTYVVSNPAWKRPEWDAPENLLGESLLPAGETTARERYRRLLVHLRALPRDRAGYGMIHQDAHGGNFFIDESGQITLFDFDTCVYGHFIYDLAMVLFYAASASDDPTAFTARFMPALLRGYREEYQFDPCWLPELPYFLKLREIDLLAQFLHDYPDGNFPDDSFCAWFMAGRRERIAEDVPYIEFPWERL